MMNLGNFLYQFVQKLGFRIKLEMHLFWEEGVLCRKDVLIGFYTVTDNKYWQTAFQDKDISSNNKFSICTWACVFSHARESDPQINHYDFQLTPNILCNNVYFVAAMHELPKQIILK